MGFQTVSYWFSISLLLKFGCYNVTVNVQKSSVGNKISRKFFCWLVGSLLCSEGLHWLLWFSPLIEKLIFHNLSWFGLICSLPN